MNDYSFLADLLNKFHTSLPWIQFFWIVSIPAFLFSLAWCIKEIFVAFAQRAKPEGELICTIYSNDEDKFLVYSHAPSEEIDSNNINNILKLLIGRKSKRIADKVDDDGKGN